MHHKRNTKLSRAPFVLFDRASATQPRACKMHVTATFHATGSLAGEVALITWIPEGRPETGAEGIRKRAATIDECVSEVEAVPITLPPAPRSSQTN